MNLQRYFDSFTKGKTMISVDALREILKPFGRVLRSGSHSPGDGAVCMLEAESVRLDIPFTDSPEKVRMWDLRDLNDIQVSSRIRTNCLLPVWAAYAGSRSWPIGRQHRVLRALAVGVARELFPNMAAFSSGTCRSCRNIETLEDAAAAVHAARKEVGRAAETDGWHLGSRWNEGYARAEDASGSVLVAVSAAAADSRFRDIVSQSAAAAALAVREVIYAAAPGDKERLFREACLVFLSAAGSVTRFPRQGDKVTR